MIAFLLFDSEIQRRTERIHWETERIHWDTVIEMPDGTSESFMILALSEDVQGTL